MSVKIEFVERASAAGANIAELCRQTGITRQTAYKWLRRFKEGGYEALEEVSRRPKTTPLSTAEDVVAMILDERGKHPSWGASKIARILARTLRESAPSERTVARVLARFGEIRNRRRQRARVTSIVERAPEVVVTASNDVWTIDFKGWWRSADGARCEPLTVRDAFSRYVLSIKLMPTSAHNVRRELERLFRKHGVPKAIQCDNGVPFVSTRARGGLTVVSAWWTSLGVQLVRSRLGKPQDNGGHERMHRDMAADIEAHPEATMRTQQRACDKWRQEFNHVRPHDALGGRTPAEVYKPVYVPPRARTPLYPSGWIVRRVRRNGEVSVGKMRWFLSTSLQGYLVGFEPLLGIRYRAWFHKVDLGEIEITGDAVVRAASDREGPS